MIDQNSMNQTGAGPIDSGRFYMRFAAVVVTCALMLGVVSACMVESEDIPEEKPAAFGRYGSELALDLADRWPNRSPGSSQEKAAAAFLVTIFEELGYEAETMIFSFIDQTGQTRGSQNIIVRIAGTGFAIPDPEDEENSIEIRKQVIVGAHYDVSVTQEEALADRMERAGAETDPTDEGAIDETIDPEDETDPTDEDTFGSDFDLPIPFLSEFDGIHSNASGVAALLTLAAQLKEQPYGYDIVLIAFGASEAGMAGSRAFAAEMSEEDIERTDAMYNIDGIYAGDKVYAHAGQNSVLGGNQKDYEMRRKLYEVTDVYYENELYTNNRFALYTNQSGIDVPWGYGGRSKAVYREWSLRESDHTPFDNMGIPIVFFESYDYDAASLDEIKESSNPVFAETSGVIAGTPFDSADYLEKLFAVNIVAGTSVLSRESTSNEDLLNLRINNVAFIVKGAIRKGIHNAIEE